MQKTSLPDVSNKDVQIRMLVSPVTSFDVDTVWRGCGIVISRFMDVILWVSHSLPLLEVREWDLWRRLERE